MDEAYDQGAMGRALKGRPFEVSQAGIALGVLATLLLTGAVLIAFATAFASPAGVHDDYWTPIGLETRFAPATVTHLEAEKINLVRYQDGSVAAFSDVARRHSGHRKCLLGEIGPDPARYYGSAAVPGFEGRYLQEPCHLVTFDMNGKRVFGPAYGDMAPLPVEVSTGGIVLVDTYKTGRRTEEVEPGR